MLFKYFAVLLLACLRPARCDVPPELGDILASDENLSTFYSLIKASKYPDLLLKLPNSGGVTIVAPTNAAFENIPGTALQPIWDESNPAVAVPVLSYHLMPGTIATGAIPSGPTAMRTTLLVREPAWANVTGGQNVLIAKQPEGEVVFSSGKGVRTSQVNGDIVFSGGLVQTVDNLLVPPSRLEPTVDAFQLSSFLGLLYAGKMMPRAAEEPDVTIFAPRNKAIQLVAASLEGLDAAEVARLAGYHIIPGRVLPAAMLAEHDQDNNTLATSAQRRGDNATLELVVRRRGNNVYVNSAQIVQPDVLIANGILHIVDNVLNPDAPVVEPVPGIASQPPVFGVMTSTRTNLPFTTALPCTANCPEPTTSQKSHSPTPTVKTEKSEDSAARCTGGAMAAVVGLGVGMALMG